MLSENPKEDRTHQEFCAVGKRKEKKQMEE